MELGSKVCNEVGNLPNYAGCAGSTTCEKFKYKVKSPDQLLYLTDGVLLLSDSMEYTQED